MNRTGKVIVYTTGSFLTVIFLLCSRFFENQKFIIAAMVVVAVMLFMSLSNSAKKDRDRKEYDITESIKKAAKYESEGKELNTKSAAEERYWDDIKPIRIEDNTISFNLVTIKRILARNDHYKYKGTIKLTSELPVINMSENGFITQSYQLQTEDGENFKGKFFRFSLNVFNENSEQLAVHTEGYVTDSESTDSGEKTSLAVYRFEKHYLEKKTKNASMQAYRKMKGKDLEEKGLSFAGMAVKRYVRCVGVCQKCLKSFVFYTHPCAGAFSEPIYSDDGLDVYELTEEISDSSSVNGKWKVGDKTFRYYNSFCCPHCGEAYIDYNRLKGMKRPGNLVCVHLGHEEYKD